MSQNRADLQRTPSRLLTRQLTQYRQSAQRQATLQKQGNEALSLGVLEGYFAISLPTTIEPSVAMAEVVAPTGTTILIGNLMYSIYYPYAVGEASPSGFVYDNRDVGDLYPQYLTWECFLAYDRRPKGAGEVADITQVIGTGVPENTARIVARIRSTDTWSIPPGAQTQAFVFYQIRATMM